MHIILWTSYLEVNITEDIRSTQENKKPTIMSAHVQEVRITSCRAGRTGFEPAVRCRTTA